MAVIKRVVGQITLSRIVDVVSTTYFYLLMPSIAAAPSKPTTSPPPTYETEGYSGWSETEPAYVSGDTRSLYVTVRTVYGDGSFEYTTPSLSSSYEAAKQAYNRAQSAMSLAGDINQYFWEIPEAYSTSVPAGAYITEVAQRLFKPNPSGGNVVIQSTGITIRNGATELSSLTGSGLNFYDPNPIQGGNNLILSINNGGILQSGNYYKSSTSSKFSNEGTKIDLTNGDIITKYFRLSQGMESGINAGAYIYGTIEALDGTIGTDSTNYWEIGNSTDYNLHDTAKIIGHGSSYIQLGDSLTWRLATNRIHTGWYTSSDTVLHYPIVNSKYWDFGIHVPYSDTPSGRGNDKFLYIRTQKDANNSLENLLYDLDDNYDSQQWEYKFWVDSSGNVHAPGFYVGNSTTPIGGGANTIAQKIINSDGTTFGKGSTTKPIYIDNNGYVQEINYTIQTSVPSGAVFTDHITTATTTGNGNAVTSITADANGALTVTKGTTFSTTDKNVQSTEANTTKLWLVGSDTSGTRTGTLKYDSGVYITATAGTLHATTFEGNLSGTASRATADSDGNTIKTTYLKLSGGTVTGAVTFEDSVSIDELTVNTANFTDDAQFSTINGVAVGNNPKFTDNNTTYTFTSGTNEFTVTPSGGTAQTVTVTPSITNNITGSGTNGYLAKFTGGNTIGNGPALGTDTTKFLNNKGEWAVPAGTGLTSVAASGSGGITISGSPITTSGTIAIGLNLSTAINGLGEGTSPATRDDYAVVQYAGGGTTTTSYHRRKLSNVFAALNSSDITTALGYTPYDATNPNGYTSNTGTVTSVATNSPITGGTITGSGTIGHATSGVGNAVTTAGLYKFKYDTYGHVTGVTAVVKADITGLGIPAQDTTYSNASTTTAGLMSAADKKKLDDIQVDSSGQAVAANVAGRWGIDVTFSDTNVAQVGHANSAITASNTQASTVSSATTKTTLDFGSIVKLPYVSYDTYGHVTSKSEVYFQLPAAPSSTTNATNDSDGNPINTTYIKKSIGTAAGDIIYWSASGTPTRLAKGSNGQVLKLANGVPTWGTDNNDNTWRAIQVNGTDILGTGTSTGKLNLKAGSNVTITNDSGTVTIASSYTNTDTKVTQAYSTTNNSYPLLMTATSGVSSTSSRGDTTAILNNAIYANPSTGMITAFGLTAKKVNNFITGSGTAASDKGSGVSPRYFPAKWTFNIGSTLTDGDIITIKIPVAGHSYGVYLSIDNGTTYKPIVLNGTGRLTTHYGVNTYLTLIYEASGSAADMYALNGADTRATVTGGAWRVINYYDSNSNTIPQAQCETAAATAAKAASMTYYTATANRYVMVNIRYANTSQTALTLNINSTGAKPIYINGSASSTSNYTLPAGSYLVFYNGTNYYFRTDNIITGNITGNAATATKLASAQTVYVALGTASTTTTIQGGSSSAQTIGVNGTLGIGNGGTGLTASPSMLTNLASTTAANVLQASPRPGVTGTLGVGNGGTGQTSAKNAANAFLNALDTGSSTPVDADYYISQYVSGGTTTTTYHRRPMSALWNYISGKISSSGTYVTIDTDQTITANQKTFNGAIRWGTASKYGAAHYDSTLEAIVFSFA